MKTTKNIFFSVVLLLSTAEVLSEIKCERNSGGTIVCVNTNIGVNNCQCEGQCKDQCVISQDTTTNAPAADSSGNAIGNIAHDFDIRKAQAISNFTSAIDFKVPAKIGEYSLYSFKITAGADKGKTVYVALRREALDTTTRAELSAQGHNSLIAVWANVGGVKSLNANKELKAEFVDVAEISFDSNTTNPATISFAITPTTGEFLGGGFGPDGSAAQFRVSSAIHSFKGRVIKQ